MYITFLNFVYLIMITSVQADALIFAFSNVLMYTNYKLWLHKKFDFYLIQFLFILYVIVNKSNMIKVLFSFFLNYI
jgi:hypothetical protein